MRTEIGVCVGSGVNVGVGDGSGVVVGGGVDDSATATGRSHRREKQNRKRHAIFDNLDLMDTPL
jgi:hypothetical protein